MISIEFKLQYEQKIIEICTKIQLTVVTFRLDPPIHCNIVQNAIENLTLDKEKLQWSKIALRSSIEKSHVRERFCSHRGTEEEEEEDLRRWIEI